MRRYMLDTNTVSKAIRGDRPILHRLVATPMQDVSISAVTEAELRYGLAKRPEAVGLNRAVLEFLKRVESLTWDSQAALVYGEMRAELERKGRILSPLDLMIAAHAKCLDLTLVTDDHAFSMVPDLSRETWSQG